MALLGTSWDDPRTQGILGMASGLLQASGSSPRPIGMGEAMGLGLQGMQGGMQQAQMMQQAQARTQMMQAEAERKQRMQQMMQQAFGIPSPQDLASQGPIGPAGTTQAPSQRSRPGGFPFSLEQVMALQAAGGPNFFDQYKYAQDGVKREAGQFYQNPITGEREFIPRLPEGATLTPDGRVQMLPGFAEAQAGMQGLQTGAQEHARSQFDLVDVYDPTTDSMRKVSRAEALQGNFQSQQREGDTEYERGQAKEAATVYGTIQAAGRTASTNIAKLRMMDQLLDETIQGGGLAALGKSLASNLASLGIHVDPNLSRKEAADVVTNELALEMRSTADGGGMPGSLSDSDRRFLMQSVPGLTQTAEGRKMIIRSKMALEQRKQDTADFARKWNQQFGRIDRPDSEGRFFQDYLQEWSEANPLFGSF